MKVQIVFALMLGIVCIVFGCVTAPRPAPKPKTMTLSYELPVVDATPDSPAEREIDGVVIALAPTRFNARRTTKITMRELPTFIVANEQYTYEKTETPIVTIAPSNLEFAVKVTNRLDHVLRFSGAALSVKVNGKRIKVEGDQDLLSAVIAPGDNYDAKLNLGSISSLGEATIAIDLFDVPTVTDAAGNATKKTAFQWVFKLASQAKEEPATVKVSEVMMTRQEAAPYFE